jgi:allantoinase
MADGTAEDRRIPVGFRWPNGAGLAVSLVVNVEEGAELSVERGDERNESVYEVTEEVVGAPDPCMESHFAYGAGPGWRRVREALVDRGAPATMSVCGRAALTHPHMVREAVADGHEIAAHGWRWERHAGMSEEHEREVIARTYTALRDIGGVPVEGWHTRSATTPATRRLLIEHGAFRYDSNAYDDDVPRVVRTDTGAHVVLPYAFDTNDMRFTGRGDFVHADDFVRYCRDAVDRLAQEAVAGPRMLTIGLHPRIIGRPARIDALERVLDDLVGRDDVWLARRRDIAASWLHGVDRPAGSPA